MHKRTSGKGGGTKNKTLVIFHDISPRNKANKTQAVNCLSQQGRRRKTLNPSGLQWDDGGGGGGDVGGSVSLS